MLHSRNICSVTDFRQNTNAHLSRLETSGEAEVLTINGEAKAVLLSPRAYDQLVADAQFIQSIRTIQQSEKDIAAGKFVPARQSLQKMMAQLSDESGA